MTQAHTHNQLRSCGATTIVSGQSSVRVNGLLWAVEGDQNTHVDGHLHAVNGTSVKINGKNVITVNDPAIDSDGAGHSPIQTKASQGSPNVNAY